MKKSTLIIGTGTHAVLAAQSLSTLGVDVFLCAKEKISDALKLKETENLHIYEEIRVVSSKGCIGDFYVTLESNGSKKSLNISTILIAEEYARVPAYEAYGLSDSFSVTRLSDVNDIIAETAKDIYQTVAFLTGVSYESHPHILEEVMCEAMSLQRKQNLQVYIFTGNLKVAQNGLEAMYRESRKHGVIYIKCAESFPEITQSQNGSVTITFIDELSCEQFNLTPDTTVVDETIQPDEYFNHLAKVFGLDTDATGFLQTANVRRTPVFTNVRGILAAGPSRRIQSASAHLNDMAIASDEILSIFDKNPDHSIKAKIFEGVCIRCLTCVRVCPYKSIVLNAKPVVMPDACEGCGICASKCPRHAITLEHLTVQSISDKIALFSNPTSKKTFTPHIIAFCCNRSAVTAYEHACLTGNKIPKGIKIVDVPCGGAISFEHILFTIKSGADGVMIVTCHDGNCHGERGNRYARSNAEMAQEYLVQAGMEKERVNVIPIAANMGAAFSQESIVFNKRIKELGPSRLVKK